jgi:hypothetical protein
MKRLLYEINAFEELFGSALVENGKLNNGLKQGVFWGMKQEGRPLFSLKLLRN